MPAAQNSSANGPVRRSFKLGKSSLGVDSKKLKFIKARVFQNLKKEKELEALFKKEEEQNKIAVGSDKLTDSIGSNDGSFPIKEEIEEDGEIKEDLDEIKEEDLPSKIEALEKKSQGLYEEKHKLFLLLKQVLNEDEKRKEAERKLQEQKRLEEVRLHGGGEPPSTSSVPTSSRYMTVPVAMQHRPPYMAPHHHSSSLMHPPQQQPLLSASGSHSHRLGGMGVNSSNSGISFPSSQFGSSASKSPPAPSKSGYSSPGRRLSSESGSIKMKGSLQIQNTGLQQPPLSPQLQGQSGGPPMSPRSPQLLSQQVGMYPPESNRASSPSNSNFGNGSGGNSNVSTNAYDSQYSSMSHYMHGNMQMGTVMFNPHVHAQMHQAHIMGMGGRRGGSHMQYSQHSNVLFPPRPGPALLSNPPHRSGHSHTIHRGPPDIRRGGRGSRGGMI